MTLAIDLFSMTYLDHSDHELLVIDRVENSVLSVAKSILLLPRQLLASGRSWIGRQGFYPRYNLASVRLRKCLYLLRGRRLDEQAIACHVGAIPSRTPRNPGSALWLAFETRPNRQRPRQGSVAERRSPNQTCSCLFRLPSAEEHDVPPARGRLWRVWIGSYPHNTAITSRRQVVKTAMTPPNNATNLTVRPVTRLADFLPKQDSTGRGQRARPSRPTGYRGRLYALSDSA